MADVVSPEIAPCVDALILENTGHDQKSAYAVLLPGSLADAEDEGTLIVEPDVMVIRRHVLQEVAGGIVIPLAVHPSAGEIAGIVDARHRDTAAEEVGAAKCNDSGVHGAHAASHGNRKFSGCIALRDKGDDLIGNIVVIILLNISAAGFVPVEIGPAFLVNCINCKYHDISAVDEIGDGGDHTEIFKVGARRVLGRKNQERESFFPVDQDMHLPVKAVAVMCIIFSFHSKQLLAVMAGENTRSPCSAL